MASVHFTDKGQERLDEIKDPDLRSRILSKLDDVEDWPGHYLERLQGYPYYKLRVGDYRVITRWDKDVDKIYVLTLGLRDKIYQRLQSGRF